MTAREWLEKFCDGYRMDTVLCIYGPQGSGKGILAKMIASWCDAHEIYWPERTYFDGRFHGVEFVGKELVIFDEFIGRYATRLKEWASNSRMQVEKRAVGPVIVDNTASFVIIRDQEWIERHDRRIVNCSVMEGLAILAEIMTKQARKD